MIFVFISVNVLYKYHDISEINVHENDLAMKIGHTLQKMINYIQLYCHNIKTHTVHLSFMNTRTKQLLEKIYYNLSNSGAYLGPEKT